MVFSLCIHDGKGKTKAMKAIASVKGIDSMNIDMNDNKLTVVGVFDPLCCHKRLTRVCKTEIFSLEIVKDEEKKEEPKKEEPKTEEPKKETKRRTKMNISKFGLMNHIIPICHNIMLLLWMNNILIVVLFLEYFLDMIKCKCLNTLLSDR